MTKSLSEINLNLINSNYFQTVLVYGIVAIGSGYIAQYMGDSILQITISIFGFVGGPLTSLIVMGICFPFINSWVSNLY